MWLPSIEECLFSLEDESNFNEPRIKNIIKSSLDLQTWHNNFTVLYKNWLNDNSEEIYNINSAINLEIIRKITSLNQHLKEVKIFYWFDIDRSKSCNEDYLWQHCPLSNLPLIELKSVHPNNKYISSKHPLVFPE